MTSTAHCSVGIHERLRRGLKNRGRLKTDESRAVRLTLRSGDLYIGARIRGSCRIPAGRDASISVRDGLRPRHLAMGTRITRPRHVDGRPPSAGPAVLSTRPSASNRRWTSAWAAPWMPARPRVAQRIGASDHRDGQHICSKNQIYPCRSGELAWNKNGAQRY